MPDSMLHYYYGRDLIFKLDEKYKKQINYSDERAFLYFNILDLGYYYQLSKIFSKDKFNLSEKMHKKNYISFLENAINYTRDNGFDKDNVFFIYGIVTHYILDLFMNPFIEWQSNYLKKKRGAKEYYKKALDYIVAKEKESINLGRTNLYKKFRGAFILNFQDLNILDYCIKRTYYFSRSYEYFKISLKNFKNFMLYKTKDYFCIKRFIYNIYDKTINRNGIVLKSSMINPKKINTSFDFKNNQHRIFKISKDNTSSLSFDELYDFTLNEGIVALNAVNEFLFLNNRKKFDSYFSNKLPMTYIINKN